MSQAAAYELTQIVELGGMVIVISDGVAIATPLAVPAAAVMTTAAVIAVGSGSGKPLSQEDALALKAAQDAVDAKVAAGPSIGGLHASPPPPFPVMDAATIARLPTNEMIAAGITAMKTPNIVPQAVPGQAPPTFTFRPSSPPPATDNVTTYPQYVAPIDQLRNSHGPFILGEMRTMSNAAAEPDSMTARISNEGVGKTKELIVEVRLRPALSQASMGVLDGLSASPPIFGSSMPMTITPPIALANEQTLWASCFLAIDALNSSLCVSAPMALIASTTS